MFVSSLWDVKEPTRYSRRVMEEVPGVVAVLLSPEEVTGLAVMSLKRRMVYEATYANTAISQKRKCQVLEHVDVDVDVDADLRAEDGKG